MKRKIIAASVCLSIFLSSCSLSSKTSVSSTPETSPPSPSATVPLTKQPADDRPTIPDNAPAGISYDFLFSERYDDKVSTDYSLYFPDEAAIGTSENDLTILDAYHSSLVPTDEIISDGEGMVPHMYKWYWYDFNTDEKILVKTDFYEPDNREYISTIWTNFNGARTSFGVAVGSSEKELLSAYTDNLFYISKEESEHLPYVPDETYVLDANFDYAYLWQPFTAENNEVRDIVFYVKEGAVSSIFMTKPLELRFVYGFDRESSLEIANNKRAEFSK